MLQHFKKCIYQITGLIFHAPKHQNQKQAYLQLIKEMVDCDYGKEIEILRAYPELINHVLIQMMRAEAKKKQRQKGQKGRAGLLKNWAKKIEAANYSLSILQEQENRALRNIQERVAKNFVRAEELGAANLDSFKKQAEATRLLQQGIQQHKQGQFREALQSGQQALKLYQQIKDRAGEGVTLGAMGNAYYSLGQFQQAIDLYKQYLAIAKDLGDRAGEGVALGNLGNAYNDLGQFQQAIELYKQHLAIAREVGDRAEEGVAWGNLGNAYYNLGQVQQAIKCYMQDLAIAQELEDRAAEGITLGNLGRVYADLGQFQQAIKLYKQHLAIAKKVRDRAAEGNTLGNLGGAYRNLGQFQQAIKLYKQHLAIAREVGDRAGEGIALGNLGYAYADLGQFQQAINYLEQGLAITQEVGNRAWEGGTLGNLGAVHLLSNQIPKALLAWRAGLAACPPNQFPVEALKLGRGLGDAAFHIKDWQTAIEGYEAAITAVETSCTFAEFYQEKQKRRTAQIGVYEKLVQACINSGDIGRALASVERSKSRNLIELLANRDIYPKGNVPPEIFTQLDTLRREVTAKQQLLETLDNPTKTDSPLDTNLGQGRSSSSRGFTPDAIETIRQEYQKAEQKLNKLLDIIKTYDPTFSLTQRVEPIKFSEIQGLLDEHTALIEWYCTRERIYAFVVTGGDGGISFQVSTPEAYTQLQELRQTYLDTYSQKKSDWEEQFNHYLHRLADILHVSELIAPLTDKYRQLILVPYRDLHLFPLHILPLDNGSNPQYLADKFADGVKYVPSCQFLQEISRRNRKDTSNNTSPRFFAIQNPTEDLEYADLEVQAISPAFQPHARILPKKAASKAALKETATAQDFQGAEYIHFAGHGAFNFVSPLLSPLVLAGAVVKREDGQTESLPRENHPEPEPEPELTGNSRYIPWRKGKTLDLTLCYTLGELFQLDLPYCRLVILSACETGLMDFSPQLEEYISLGLGFLYAGAPNVICSLWAVNDLSTAILMVKLYEEMANQPSVAIALKAAQQWMRTVTKQKLTEWLNPPAGDLNAPVKQKIADNVDFDLRPSDYQPYQHPFHWAAFCAIGI